MDYPGGSEQPSSLSSKVFNKLMDDILNGKYKLGETLVESKIAKQLGVSRTPVREALKQLELEGLVESLPNRRVIVKGISQRDIDDIYIIRKAIEGLAARWATTNITDEQLEELKLLVELEEFYTLKNNKEKVKELDSRFHNLIFEASNSKPLRYILSTFHEFTKKARYDSLKVEGRMLDTLDEHRSILNAIINKEPEQAEKAMIRHISGAKKNYSTHYEKVK